MESLGKWGEDIWLSTHFMVSALHLSCLLRRVTDLNQVLAFSVPVFHRHLGPLSVTPD
jgi:hypothetical protein